MALKDDGDTEYALVKFDISADFFSSQSSKSESVKRGGGLVISPRCDH